MRNGKMQERKVEVLSRTDTACLRHELVVFVGVIVASAIFIFILLSEHSKHEWDAVERIARPKSHALRQRKLAPNEVDLVSHRLPGTKVQTAAEDPTIR